MPSLSCQLNNNNFWKLLTVQWHCHCTGLDSVQTLAKVQFAYFLHCLHCAAGHANSVNITVKVHFVTVKHVVMFFKLQFSYQQLVFIFKIVITLVIISQSYPAIWKSCVWILLIHNQLMLLSPLPFHLEIVSNKIHQRTLILWDFFISLPMQHA